MFYIERSQLIFFDLDERPHHRLKGSDRFPRSDRRLPRFSNLYNPLNLRLIFRRGQQS